MQRALAWLREVAGTFCAAVLVYAVIGGLATLILATPNTNRADCWPHFTIFWIDVWCGDPWLNVFWYATIGLPTSLVSLPAIAIRLLIEAVDPSSVAYTSMLAAYIDRPFSIAAAALVVLMSWAGFEHWRARSPIVAWALLAGFVSQVLFAATFQ